MGFWLAKERTAQQASFIQRFDPRFWTVNFPRPMMASVVTTAPGTLRVDATFYNSDDLAGLIWDSEDTLDHVLLAYETNRDYARLSLRFHWRSSGIMPLDQVNGPTLTIEGRDALGNPKAWYVRLWNYASGTPTDADINLEFSSLDGGFVLPGEADPVHPNDIDRLFISIIPPDYDGVGTRYPTPQIGWVEMSAITADGGGAILEIGDVVVPENGLSMATGYDDSFNQTPERLLRSIRALGYRGAINHYVGMSHYFRLETSGPGLYASLSAPHPGEEFAAINQPCAIWHRDFVTRAEAMDFTVIFSLSYELFDAHCWNDWKQRAENGDPALTGWVPPSTLLSPAQSSAMGYLQAVARAFTAIARDAGAAIKFQVGEPWWWVMPDDGRICLYDAAAQAEFGDALVSITDINGPKTAAQNAMLDQAGAMLAQSTADLVAAVTAEALGAPVETLLLAYLPTILDEAAPEAKRANLPIGWASPAFDILQLEDYDWVIAGDQSATQHGIDLATARLGYPIGQQHYFSGFVLTPDADFIWANMVDAVAAAQARGTPEIFIWALPQVARDGFTYFQEQEDDMDAFDDVQFPLTIGRGATVSPRFSTDVVATLSGHEKRNSDWADARLEFDAGPGVRSEEELRTLIAFFRARRGAAKAFRFTDPYDHSSNAMIDPPTMTDQIIGVGDGEQTRFPLIKSYGDGEDAQQRLITRPEPSSLLIAVDGAIVSNWSLGALGDIIFDSPPALDSEITAGFLFDVPVRFAEDRLDVSAHTFLAGEIPEVRLIEVREAP